VDAHTLVHRTTAVAFPAWGRWWVPLGTRTTAVRCADDGLSTIHSSYYCYHSYEEHVMGKVAL
jgi:hypothetical protein